MSETAVKTKAIALGDGDVMVVDYLREHHADELPSLIAQARTTAADAVEPGDLHDDERRICESLAELLGSLVAENVDFTDVAYDVHTGRFSTEGISELADALLDGGDLHMQRVARTILLDVELI